MMVLWGLGGVFGGSREFWGEVWGGPEGVTFLPKGTFCPSGSLVRHQIVFQILHNGQTGITGPFLAHWGPSRDSQKIHSISK